ncbi:MAG: phytoene desaturase family protein, partial [Chitinophagales bacterium]
MSPKNKKVIVIGAGFSGLSAAAFLSRQGYAVEVHEKNNEVGGRARVLSEDGFVFDMGPSWYWMPGVAERFFNSFGKTASDFFELKKISPSFRMFFGKDDYWDVPSEPDEIQELFEKTEPGASEKFKEFMKEAGAKYETAMKEIIFHPGLSWTEYLNWPLFKGMWRYSLFTSFRSHIKKYFRHPRLLSLMEFPVLFLGASPDRIPALYSLLNYSGLMQGTWYPMGGMHKLAGAMREIAEENGATIHPSSEVDSFSMRDHSITHCSTSGRNFECDAVVASADYHHIEQNLLEKPFRRYSEKYWDKRIMAPSCLIFFLGVNKRIK